jgi:hypothetical protein
MSLLADRKRPELRTGSSGKAGRFLERQRLASGEASEVVGLLPIRLDPGEFDRRS